MKAQRRFTSFRHARRDQLLQERIRDAYKQAAKLREPSICPSCGAVFHAGRWQWGPRPEGADEVLCSACHRIRDHFPAGYVHLEGAYMQSHRDELLRLLRNHEERAKAEHPMERIMGVEEHPDRVTVATTDIHLARDLGNALRHACQGQLDFHYNEGQNLVRVHWKR